MKITYAEKDSQLYGYAVENRLKCVPGEKKFKEFCEKYKIPYEHQVPVYFQDKNKKPQGYILDFEIVFPVEEKTYWKYLTFVVEIDGEYHSNKEQKLKDYERDLNLLDGKWSMIIHLTDEQVEDEETLMQVLLNEVQRLAPKKDRDMANRFIKYVQQNWGKYKDETPQKDNSIELMNLKAENKELVKLCAEYAHRYEMLQMATGVYDKEVKHRYSDLIENQVIVPF